MHSREQADIDGNNDYAAAKLAAKAAANLPLSMVVPPQDVVDDRFQKQCLITISVAGVIVRYLGFWI